MTSTTMRFIIRTRKYYIEKGLRLKKIHCAIRFYESDWMRPYIEINIILRQQTTNSFERDLFKKMVNAVYGKTCENRKKRSDIRLTTSKTQYLRFTNQPQFRQQRIFNEKLVVVHMDKPSIKIDRPFYVGFTVLE